MSSSHSHTERSLTLYWSISQLSADRGDLHHGSTRPQLLQAGGLHGLSGGARLRAEGEKVLSVYTRETAISHLSLHPFSPNFVQLWSFFSHFYIFLRYTIIHDWTLWKNLHRENFIFSIASILPSEDRTKNLTTHFYFLPYFNISFSKEKKMSVQNIQLIG